MMIERSLVCLVTALIAAGAACTSAHDPDAEISGPICDADLECSQPDADWVDSGAPLPPRGEPQGYASCEGIVTLPDFAELRYSLPLAEHREAPSTCALTRPCNHVYKNVAATAVCRSHSDCAQGKNGRCQSYGYECTYDECFSDSDCRPDQLCDCTGGLNGAHRCLAADCRTDADCAEGGCSPSKPVDCYNLFRASAYRCHTRDDECTTDTDCEGGACVFDPARSHWRCSDAQCLVP